jgi:hypothetical protein
MRPSENRIARNVRSIGGALLDRILYVIEFIFKVKMANTNPSAVAIDDANILVYSVYVNNEMESDWLEVAEIAVAESFHPIVVNTGSVKISTRNRHITTINRENVGRDLASYGVALSHLDLSNLDTLVLMNDSMDWNKSFVRSILTKKDFEENAIYALTLSKQKRDHLQTFLLVFNSSVMLAASELKSQRFFRFKRVIVREGEIRLSERWSQSGYTLKPLFEAEYLMRKSLIGHSLSSKEKHQILKFARSGVHLNPSIHFWEALYLETASIKKSIYQINPGKMEKFPKNRSEASNLSHIHRKISGGDRCDVGNYL